VLEPRRRRDILLDELLCRLHPVLNLVLWRTLGLPGVTANTLRQLPPLRYAIPTGEPLANTVLLSLCGC
jgi:hypothetical protein